MIRTMKRPGELRTQVLPMPLPLDHPCKERKKTTCLNSRVFWKILSRKCISLFSLNTFDVVDVDDGDVDVETG